MNKFINILLLLVSFPTMLLTIFVGFDLPIEFARTTGAILPHKNEIFLTIGLIYFILIARRSVKRWMGIKLANTVNRFKWNVPVSNERKKYVYTYQALEAGIMFGFGIALYVVSPVAIWPFIALTFGALDNIIFSIIGTKKNSYRIGLSSKAVIVADREVKVLYLTGLRQVSVQQNTVYFDYIKNLQLNFPLSCIQQEDRAAFKTELESLVDRNKVFFSESFKSI